MKVKIIEMVIYFHFFRYIFYGKKKGGGVFKIEEGE